MVIIGLPCPFSLILPPYLGAGGRCYKWFALHLFPDIPALSRVRSHGYKWNALPFPFYPCPTPGMEAVVTDGLWAVVTNDCPAPFLCYPHPTPWLGAVIANGLSFTCPLLSPSYPGVGGRGYKWIVLHLFLNYPRSNPGLRTVVSNGLPCTFSQLSPP